MKTISPYRKIFLVAYYPMAYNELGIRAINQYNQLPFIDGSCRREPDFENPYPSITSLCRGPRLISRLAPNDLVVYVAVKKQYYDSKIRAWRLTAVLKVMDILEDHSKAASFYKGLGVPIPVNCMVPGNNPKSFLESSYRFPDYKGSDNPVQIFLQKPLQAQVTAGQVYLKVWDQEYQNRAEAFKKFAITEIQYLELKFPFAVTVTGSQTLDYKLIKNRFSPELTADEFNILMQNCNIPLNV